MRIVWVFHCCFGKSDNAFGKRIENISSTVFTVSETSRYKEGFKANTDKNFCQL